MNDLDQTPLAASTAENSQYMVQQWLSSFELALQGKDATAIAPLFAPDSHWRDLLAFTGNLTPHRGAERIATELSRLQASTQARAFTIAHTRTPPGAYAAWGSKSSRRCSSSKPGSAAVTASCGYLPTNLRRHGCSRRRWTN